MLKALVAVGCVIYAKIVMGSIQRLTTINTLHLQREAKTMNASIRSRAEGRNNHYYIVQTNATNLGQRCAQNRRHFHAERFIIVYTCPIVLDGCINPSSGSCWGAKLIKKTGKYTKRTNLLLLGIQRDTNSVKIPCILHVPTDYGESTVNSSRSSRSSHDLSMNSSIVDINTS